MDNTANPQQLDDITLKHGAHRRREQGMCLMEAVAWIAGEPHSDRPQCADRALAAYGRALNDRLSDDERQLLRPLIPKLVGTSGSLELETRRAYFIVDRYMRHDIPAFMRELPNKPRPDIAERFEQLPAVVNAGSAARARELAREIRDDIWKNLADAAADAYAAHAAYAAYAAAADAYAADAYAAAADAYAADAYAAAADAYAAAADADAYAAAADAYAAAADAAYAAAADAYAYAADAYAAHAAADFETLRESTVKRAIATLEAAIALTGQERQA